MHLPQGERETNKLRRVFPPRWLAERLSFWWEAIRSAVWLLAFALWSAFCFATQIRDNFVSADQQKKLGTLEILSRFNWRTWAIGALLIGLIATLEGAYRVYRNRLKIVRGMHKDELESARNAASESKHQVDILELETNQLKAETRRLTEKHNAAAGFVEYLEKRLAPKLKILFEADKSPYMEHVQERGRTRRSGYWKIFRVGVTNEGEGELRGISVELEGFNLGHGTYDNVPLRVMHDVGPIPVPRQSFSLRPGRTEYVDVVMREMHPAKGVTHKSTEMCFSKDFGFVPGVGLQEPLAINMAASAYDTPTERKQFVIYIDETDQLQMKEVEVQEV